MVIDCFSKFLFVEPLKRKTSASVIAAFKRIFKITSRRPNHVRTDKGTEFTAKEFRKFMKDNEITFSTTQNPDIKCSIAERCIRTIKSKLFKYLTYKNTYRYIDVLDDAAHSYNNSYHKTIKMTPSEVNDKNILHVYRSIEESHKSSVKNKRPKQKVGDHVRITKTKGIFQKGYLPCFTQEIFKVKSIAKRNPIVYYLEDLAGEEIEGTFYEMEVQKVKFDEGAARAIPKIIKQRRRGKSIQYYVKWSGYPDKFNCWIDAKSVTET